MIKSRLNANFLTEQIIQGKYHLSRIEPGDDIKVINRLNLNFTKKKLLAHVQKFTQNILYERLSRGEEPDNMRD